MFETRSRRARIILQLVLTAAVSVRFMARSCRTAEARGVGTER